MQPLYKEKGDNVAFEIYVEPIRIHAMVDVLSQNISSEAEDGSYWQRAQN